MTRFFCAQRGCSFELEDKPAELEPDGVTVKTPATPAAAPELCAVCGNPFVPHPSPATSATSATSERDEALELRIAAVYSAASPARRRAAIEAALAVLEGAAP